MPLGTVPFDPAERLCDPRDWAEIISEAFATGDAVIRKVTDAVEAPAGSSACRPTPA